MVSFNKYYVFVEDVAEKIHNLATDTLRIALASGVNAPSPTCPTLTGVGEILNGNGYTRSGNATTVVTSAQTGGFYKLVLNNPATWTGGPAAMDTFRYAVLYNDTPATKPVIGYWDYGTTVTLNSGETFTVTLDGTAGVLTIQ